MIRTLREFINLFTNKKIPCTVEQYNQMDYTTNPGNKDDIECFTSSSSTANTIEVTNWEQYEINEFLSKRFLRRE